MSFALEVVEIVERARKEMREKTKEERKQFLVRSGIVSESGKLLSKFQPEKSPRAKTRKAS